MSRKSSHKTLIITNDIEIIKTVVTKRFDFLILLRIAKKPIEAKHKSIIGLCVSTKGKILRRGKMRQCTKHIVALEIPKIS